MKRLFEFGIINSILANWVFVEKEKQKCERKKKDLIVHRCKKREKNIQTEKEREREQIHLKV